MATPAAVLSILVTANTSQANAALASTNANLKKTAATANSTSTAMGTKLAKGAKLAGTAVAAMAAYGLYKGIKAGAEFEKQMDAVGAVSNATATQMSKLEKQALALGESTFFSANEVAKAQAELAKGGLTVKQILGGALPAALALAEAGELELAEAAETTVNAMKLFGLSGKESMKVADMLATAANKTTADVSDFAMALKQGGSVAHTAGLKMGETVTILEALAEAGIKNSDAGTSMKAALIQLLKPSTKQAELTKELGLNFITQAGTMKDAVGISKELHRVTDNMTKAERAKTLGVLAGTDGFRTLSALYDAGPKKLEKFEKANQKQGTAAEIARKKMDNLSGDVEQLKGALETTGIKIQQALAPALRTVAQELTAAVQAVNQFDFKAAIQEVEQIVSALGPFETVLKIIGLAFLALLSPLALIIINFGRLEAAAKAVGNWVSQAAQNVGGFVSALLPVKIAIAVLTPIVKVLWGLFKFLSPAIVAAAKVLRTQFIESAHVAGAVIQVLLKFIGNIGAVVGDMVAIVTNLLRGDWKGAWRAAERLVVDIWHTIIDVIKGGWTVLKQIFTSGSKVIKSIIGNVFNAMVGMIRTAWRPIGDFFEGLWDRITGIFEDAKNAIIGFVEKIVDVINALPFVPDINLPGGGPSTTSRDKAKEMGQKHVGHRYTGGPINRPMAIVGEEAPQHPEWVIATNPAYKKANLAYWAAAGRDLGVPGFGIGGALTGLASKTPVGSLFNTAAGAIKNLPSTSGLPPIAKAAGEWLLKHATDWLHKKQKKVGNLSIPGAGGGVSMVDGSPVANWIARILMFARRKGVPFHVESGYRSYAEQKAIYDSGVRPAAYPGTSHHEGTKYPSGAVDLVPYGPLAAWLSQSRFAGILQWAGLSDPPHFSHHYGGGYAKGGRLPGWVHGTATLNADQLASLAHYVGMKNPALMGQIAMGESSGNPRTVGGEGERGLWQILPSTAAAFGLNWSQMFDPLANAYGAAKILAGQGIGAWHASPTGPKGTISPLRGAGGGAGGAGGTKKKFTPKIGLAKAKKVAGIARHTALTVGGLAASALPAGAANLPAPIRSMLEAPGLTPAGRMGIAEFALEQAGTTKDIADNMAALGFKKELLIGRQGNLQKRIGKINALLAKGGITAKRRSALIAKREELGGQLRETISGISGTEEEEKQQLEEKQLEATEALTQATLEMKAQNEAIAKALEAQTRFAKEATTSSSAVAWQALADILSGNLGVRADRTARTAGPGTVGTF